MTPHVRVEMRKVYVFGKRAFRAGKHEAYKQAAKAALRAACECYAGDRCDSYYFPEHMAGMVIPGTEVVCWLHTPCECKPTNEGDVDECAGHKRLRKSGAPEGTLVGKCPYWMLVCLRLQRWMKFVDGRREV